jgi:hypothetical protein
LPQHSQFGRINTSELNKAVVPGTAKSGAFRNAWSDWRRCPSPHCCGRSICRFYVRRALKREREGEGKIANIIEETVVAFGIVVGLVVARSCLSRSVRRWWRPWPEQRIWRCACGQWVPLVDLRQCPAACLQHTNAGVQSIGVEHPTGVSRNSSLACESRFSIWQRLIGEKTRL